MKRRKGEKEGEEKEVCEERIMKIKRGLCRMIKEVVMGKEGGKEGRREGDKCLKLDLVTLTLTT